MKPAPKIRERIEYEYEDGKWRTNGDVPWTGWRTGRKRVTGYNVGYRYFATLAEAEAALKAIEDGAR